jgi:hypothetical protein
VETSRAAFAEPSFERRPASSRPLGRAFFFTATVATAATRIVLAPFGRRRLGEAARRACRLRHVTNSSMRERSEPSSDVNMHARSYGVSERPPGRWLQRTTMPSHFTSSCGPPAPPGDFGSTIVSCTLESGAR